MARTSLMIDIYIGNDYQCSGSVYDFVLDNSTFVDYWRAQSHAKEVAAYINAHGFYAWGMGNVAGERQLNGAVRVLVKSRKR